MKRFRSCRRSIASVLTIVVIATASFKIKGQDKPNRETIQAQAMGQNRVAGHRFNGTVSIDSYSTPDDQKPLITAFTQGGQAALSKSLCKMKSQGRVAVNGTLGYSIAYVRMFPTEDGRRIRLITDRPIRFLEARENGCLTDYDVSALELSLNNDKSKKAMVRGRGSL